jgi:hypothetical protein
MEEEVENAEYDEESDHEKQRIPESQPKSYSSSRTVKMSEEHSLLPERKRSVAGDPGRNSHTIFSRSDRLGQICDARASPEAIGKIEKPAYTGVGIGRKPKTET